MASTHTLLSATAGETVAGPARADLWALSSGFWIPLSDTVGVLPDGEDNLPDVFRLQQNFPNPFNPSTTIQYDLPDRCRVLVEIYNSVGQCIRRLTSEDQGPGRVRLDWDGRDQSGKTADTGVYLYRVTARSAHAAKTGSKIVFQSTKKMLLVK